MRTISILLAASVIVGGISTANASFIFYATDITATALTGAPTTPNGKLVAAGYHAYKLTVTSTDVICGFDIKNGIGYGITGPFNQKWDVVPTLDDAGNVLSTVTAPTPSGTTLRGPDSFLVKQNFKLIMDSPTEDNSLTGSPNTNFAAGSIDNGDGSFSLKNGAAYGIGSVMTEAGTFVNPAPSTLVLAYAVLHPPAYGVFKIVGDFVDSTNILTHVNQQFGPLSPPIVPPEPASLGLLALGSLGLLQKRRAK